MTRRFRPSKLPVKLAGSWRTTTTGVAVCAKQWRHGCHRLFAAIMAHGDPSQPLMLWQEFHQDLAEDLLHRGISAEAADGCVLRELDRALETMGGASLKTLHLPAPPQESPEVRILHSIVNFSIKSSMPCALISAFSRFPSLLQYHSISDYRTTTHPDTGSN